MFDNLIANVRSKKPIVHNITNYVTVNDCANIVLAIGGSPIMADAPEEVEEIAAISSSLVLNIGTISGHLPQAMLLAGKKANRLGKPVVLDPVGAGASEYRTDTVNKLIGEVKFDVIRGNISEIKCILKGVNNVRGVDAGEEITENSLDDICALAADLSRKTGSVVAITGKIDIISDGKRCFAVKNGHPMLADITGSGCMLSSLVGAFCGANADYLEAATGAVACMGLCGELAYAAAAQKGLGTLSFRTFLIDNVSLMTDERLRSGMKIEERRC